MITSAHQFVVDENGKRIAVLLEIAEYERLPEELDAVRAYDAAKAAGDEFIPLEQALAEIDQERSWDTSSRSDGGRRRHFGDCRRRMMRRPAEPCGNCATSLVRLDVAS
ncbi:MAG: hypothetical protein AB7R89_33935 [Dehalococcoidia bacterium]